MKDEAMEANEAMVRAAWEHTCFGQYESSAYGYVIVHGAQMSVLHKFEGSESGQESAWAAAAEFTTERLEQIRRVQEEIEIMREGIRQCVDFPQDEEQYGPALRRILARLESALSTLQQGMKAQSAK